jgi:7-carboxy-7-deazaguanine synthase
MDDITQYKGEIKMKIVEEFSSIQGEARYIGIPSYFIRTTGCNLRCAWKNPNSTITKCDTPYTSWSPEKGRDFNIEEFLKNNKNKAFKHIVITGGEPTMQSDLPEIVRELQRNNYKVTLETNGTRFVPGIYNAFISISPKTKSSYAAIGRELDIHTHNNEHMIDSVRKWVNSCNDYQLKFVYNSKGDLGEILRMQEELSVPSDKIYLMAQGITTKQLGDKSKEIIDICMRYNYNFAPRLHIEVWGNVRGV